MELEKVSQKLLDRYSHLYPMILNRSIAYANTLGELFDMLEGIPQQYPIVWDQEKRQWVHVKDIRKINLKG